jgi:phage baseplate assembly protein V
MEELLRRALEPIRNKIRLMAGRAVLSLLKDAVTVQVELLKDEPRDAELFQQYGFRSRPLPGAEGIQLSANGNRDHTLIFCMDDRRYQIDLLADGECAVYDYLGKYIHLKADGSIVAKVATKLRVEGGDFECTGEIKDKCDAGGYTMSAMRTKHNGHKHIENNVVGGPTAVPDSLFLP